MKHLLKAGLAAALALAATPAAAEDWRYCMTVVKDGSGKDRIAIFSPSFDAAASPGYASEWESTTRPAAEDALRQHLTDGSVKVRCQTIAQSRAENEDWRARHVSKARRGGILVEEFAWSPGGSSRASEEIAEDSRDSYDSDDAASADEGAADEQAVASEDSPADTSSEAAEASSEATDASAEAEAREAEYQAERREWEEKVAAQKAEEERQRAALAEAKKEAALEKARHEREKAAHGRLIERHMKEQQEHEAAKRRHTLCTNGNEQACREIRSGQSGTRMADGGAAGGKGPLRGFWGETCDAARRSANGGAGSVAGDVFEEVRTVPQESGCLVQGYRYGGRAGGASSQ